MKKIKIKILDFYFKHPFFIDAILIICTLFLSWRFQDYFRLSIEKSKIEGLISNITSSIISLAGFILASLTIIVTVKSNLKLKNIEDVKNSTELLLTSKNYKNIITVFRDSIIELVFGMIIMYFLWAPIFQFREMVYILLIAFGILIIVLPLIRTLLILFKIIFMEFK